MRMFPMYGLAVVKDSNVPLTRAHPETGQEEKVLCWRVGNTHPGCAHAHCEVGAEMSAEFAERAKEPG